MRRRARACVITPCLLGCLTIGCRPSKTAGADSAAPDSTATAPDRSPSPSSGAAVADSAPPAAGWRSLFDGKTTAGWRGFRESGVPAGWRVVGGALTRVGEGADLITVDQFENFELALEWKVADGANSGVFYRATEEGQHIYESGPEMQVLDDARHEDGRSRLTAAGALFGLYPSPAGVVRPAGQWNRARIVADGPRVEHWLNGVKVVEAELWSPEWERRVKAGKFASWPIFGRARRGHVGLQNHGDSVAYRDIRIRALP